MFYINVEDGGVYATVKNDDLYSPLVVMDKLEKETVLKSYANLMDLIRCKFNEAYIAIRINKDRVSNETMSFEDIMSAKYLVIDEEYTIVQASPIPGETRFFLFKGRDIYKHLARIKDMLDKEDIKQWSAVCITDEDDGRKHIMRVVEEYACKYCGDNNSKHNGPETIDLLNIPETNYDYQMRCWANTKIS